MQLETGATVVRDAGETTGSGPEALIRWSPVPRAELRLTVPDVAVGAGDPQIGSLGVGGKVELDTIAGWQAGALAMLAVPLGSGGGSVAPEAILAIGRDTAWGSLGAQASAGYTDGDVALGATFVAGRDLSARLGAFLELAADAVPGGPLALTLHHGYTLALGADAQADLHAGVGLTDVAPAAFVGAGWSVRF